MNNYIYFHICCINNWKDIFNKLMENIKKSRLYDNIKEIRCNILTKDNDLSFFSDPKIKIIGTSSNYNLYENSTINLLYEHSYQEDFNVLYIHTKGVTHKGSVNVADWVNYLTYFNIYKYDICLEELKTNDTVGVNLQELPELHYSGNFWWSKSQYIRKLEKCQNKQYCSPEFWLTEKKIGNYVSLWLSNINHYNQRYMDENYINKINKYTYNKNE